MGLVMIKFKASHQDIYDKGRINRSNSLVIKIIVLIWLVNGTLFNVSLSIMSIILNIIEMWIHHQILIVYEGKKIFLIRRKDFYKFSLTKENKLKGKGWVKWKALWSLRLFCLFSVYSVIYVLKRLCEKEELVEFVWMCVIHEHNYMCK
jgi:hypothetical protein